MQADKQVVRSSGLLEQMVSEDLCITIFQDHVLKVRQEIRVVVFFTQVVSSMVPRLVKLRDNIRVTRFNRSLKFVSKIKSPLQRRSTCTSTVEGKEVVKYLRGSVSIQVARSRSK